MMEEPEPEQVRGQAPEAGEWVTAVHRGHAGVLHGLDWPEPLRRTAWLLEADRPALVLGSGQPRSDVDEALSARLGIDVVSRRSGGGAVLVSAADVVWVDLFLPRGDLLWADDIGVAPLWVGELWAAVLAEFGVRGDVHRGAMVKGPWSRRVCFAGLAAGEVSVGGRKIVGISQRRTRSGARFQCALALRWRPEPIAALVGLAAAADRDSATGLAGEAVGGEAVGAGEAAGGLAGVAVGLVDLVGGTARAGGADEDADEDADLARRLWASVRRHL